ncbi:hypothetical protein V6N12_012998 [Hibiscus sabdariffa]|uniref:Uncharacterized protein n=1 Tax=Hibiscus sabdariffa TaxID=183260 RepID=A0ABR2EG16_9ROSI
MNQSQESSMGLEDLTAFRPRGLQLVLSLFSFTSVVAYCGKESEVSYQGRRRSNSGLGGLPVAILSVSPEIDNIPSQPRLDDNKYPCQLPKMGPAIDSDILGGRLERRLT